MDYLDVLINLLEIILVLVKHGVRLHQSPHNQRLAHPIHAPEAPQITVTATPCDEYKRELSCL